MSATGYRTIALSQIAVREEGLAGAASITPGELLQGPDTALIVHAAAAGEVVPKKIALEKQTNDVAATANIAVDYTNGETLYYAIAQPGELYYMWLAAGENAGANAMLQSNGAGALQVLADADATTVTESIVGRAKAAVNNAAGGSPVRIVVEIV